MRSMKTLSPVGAKEHTRILHKAKGVHEIDKYLGQLKNRIMKKKNTRIGNDND